MGMKKTFGERIEEGKEKVKGFVEEHRDGINMAIGGVIGGASMMAAYVIREKYHEWLLKRDLGATFQIEGTVGDDGKVGMAIFSTPHPDLARISTRWDISGIKEIAENMLNVANSSETNE